MQASPKVLLVAEDDEFRSSTARLLIRCGFSCVEATHDVEARAALDTEPGVVAVLYDINMPGQSGINLVGDFIADFPELAMVIVTGVDDPRATEAALDTGAPGLLITPFDSNELLASLSMALARRDLELQRHRDARSVKRTVARTRALDGVLEGIRRQEVPSHEDDEATIEGLSRALTLRDEETGAHIERMSRYSVVLADAVGFTGLSPEDLRLATALHDVGKIGVPDAILLKPGALSRDEYAEMQRHAQTGFQLLSGSTSSLLQASADIAFSHHEWWDGSGYPRGLQGEEISEVARIAAVADVFDALTSNRVYRTAMSFDEARDHMSELRGRQFEPRLLDAFFGAIDEISAIRDTYQDVDPQKRIRIVVVDDHEIFVHSLVRLLGTRPELKVAGTASSVSEAVGAAIAYEPDVVLMDFELPDGDGAEATAQIKALLPDVHVVMLTVHADDHTLIRAIDAGCSGFVNKTGAVEELFAAIVTAHDGEGIASSINLGPLLRQLRPTHRRLRNDLRPREIEVLGLVASGLVNKQIAERLGLSLNTVRNHVQTILYRLDAHSKLEAVATAVREGIVSPPR